MKGASVLCIHPPFNLVKGVVVDSLHAIFIGVVHQLLKLWLNKANRHKDYFIGNKVYVIITCYSRTCLKVLFCSKLLAVRNKVYGHLRTRISRLLYIHGNTYHAETMRECKLLVYFNLYW